ncbi:immunoglobulin lambda-1 light chain-like [Discoglossus pictus]
MLMFSLCRYAEGSFQTQAHQPRRVSALEGSTAILGCLIEGEEIEGLNIHWLQQKPGQAPQHIRHLNNEPRPTTPDPRTERYQAVTNSSSNAHYLHIQQVTTQDSALYWCVLARNSSYPVWGNGTRLSVFGGNDVLPPSVTLLTSGDPLTSFSPFFIMCLVSGFYPELIEVSWKLGGRTTLEAFTSGPVMSGGNESYSVSSVLELRSHQRKTMWSLSCEVRHDASRTLISKDLYGCYKNK